MTWTERIRRFEQTAPRARLVAAGFALGVAVCLLFAPLLLTGLTTEDALSYAIGLPLLALTAFVFMRLRALAPRFHLLFIPAWLLLFVGFLYGSDQRVLHDRGERTEAVVNAREPQPRSATLYQLAKPDGAPLAGRLSEGGPYDVGDRVDVVVDPLGKVDPIPADQLTAATAAPLRIVPVGAALVTATTWGAAAYAKRRRAPVPPGSPPHGAYPPPPPPPPGPAGGFGPPPGPTR